MSFGKIKIYLPNGPSELITTVSYLDTTPCPCTGATLASRRETDNAVPTVSPHRGEPPGQHPANRNPGLPASSNRPGSGAAPAVCAAVGLIGVS